MWRTSWFHLILSAMSKGESWFAGVPWHWHVVQHSLGANSPFVPSFHLCAGLSGCKPMRNAHTHATAPPLNANQQSAWFPLPGSQRLMCKIKDEGSRVFQLPWWRETSSCARHSTGGELWGEKGSGSHLQRGWGAEQEQFSFIEHFLSYSHTEAVSCSQDPFAADKDSTTNVGVVSQFLG